MKKINEWFICINCKKEISPAQKTCRNHCPYCFVSMHVDGETPWDRNTACQGIMYPTTFEIANWEFKILFECIKCWKKHRNKSSADDEILNLQKLIEEYKYILETKWTKKK